MDREATTNIIIPNHIACYEVEKVGNPNHGIYSIVLKYIVILKGLRQNHVIITRFVQDMKNRFALCTL